MMDDGNAPATTHVAVFYIAVVDGTAHITGSVINATHHTVKSHWSITTWNTRADGAGLEYEEGSVISSISRVLVLYGSQPSGEDEASDGNDGRDEATPKVPVDFEYVEFVSGGKTKVNITGYIGPGGDVVVPERINGHDVVRIKASALAGNANITSLTILSETITLEDKALHEATALMELTVLSKNFTTGSYAFQDCMALETVVIDGKAIAIGGKAFQDCIALRTLSVNGSSVSTGGSAFIGCIALESVEIRSKTQTIGANAFQGCSSLVQVGLAGE